MIVSIILIAIQLNLVIGQTCQNDIPDFFYKANFAGPLFDQSAYMVTASPNDTRFFTFNVRPQTDSNRPSFFSTSVTGRGLNLTQGVITVTSGNRNFTVTTLSNGSYALVTNT